MYKGQLSPGFHMQQGTYTPDDNLEFTSINVTNFPHMDSTPIYVNITLAYKGQTLGLHLE